MSDHLFSTLTANIDGNDNLREPQAEAYARIKTYFDDPKNTNREIGVVLPVGCGKSGLITLVPFALLWHLALKLG